MAGITAAQDVASFVAAIALASGVLFLPIAVLRMGWIAQFLSRAVVTGSNPLQELWSWLGTLGDSHL